MNRVPSALRSLLQFHYVALHFVGLGVRRAASYKPDHMRCKALSPVSFWRECQSLRTLQGGVMDWPEAANLCAFLLQEAA